MILLHHNESERSRDLLASAPAGVEVIDCTAGCPVDYPISAYPTVVVVRPAGEEYAPEYDSDGGLLGVQLTAHDEYEELIRMPASWEAVQDYLQYTK